MPTEREYQEARANLVSALAAFIAAESPTKPIALDTVYPGWKYRYHIHIDITPERIAKEES